MSIALHLPHSLKSSRRYVVGLLGVSALAVTLSATTTVDAETDATTTPAVAPLADADKKPTADANDKANANRPNRPARELPAFTPEREAAALTFVAAHHPELTPLLAGLKTSRPNEYQRAVRKLFADSERLAQNREFNPKHYELKLREWKLESRVQLLVARLTMGRTPKLEAELRTVLEEQLLVRRELLSVERDRMQNKVTALDQEINAIDADLAGAVTEQFNKALNSAGQKKPAAKAKSTAAPAAATPSNTAP
jgi:hypothetical protein